MKTQRRWTGWRAVPMLLAVCLIGAACGGEADSSEVGPLDDPLGYVAGFMDYVGEVSGGAPSEGGQVMVDWCGREMDALVDSGYDADALHEAADELVEDGTSAPGLVDATDETFVGFAGALATCASGDLDSSAALIQSAVRGVGEMGDALVAG